MATEKLTKKRLIQIILMLCVLLFAFFYRTYHYHKTNNIENIQQLSENKKASD